MLVGIAIFGKKYYWLVILSRMFTVIRAEVEGIDNDIYPVTCT